MGQDRESIAHGVFHRLGGLKLPSLLFSSQGLLIDARHDAQQRRPGGQYHLGHCVLERLEAMLAVGSFDDGSR